MGSGEGKSGNGQGNKLKAERNDRYVKKKRSKSQRGKEGGSISGWWRASGRLAE